MTANAHRTYNITAGNVCWLLRKQTDDCGIFCGSETIPTSLRVKKNDEKFQCFLLYSPSFFVVAVVVSFRFPMRRIRERKAASHYMTKTVVAVGTAVLTTGMQRQIVSMLGNVGSSKRGCRVSYSAFLRTLRGYSCRE